MGVWRGDSCFLRGTKVLQATKGIKPNLVERDFWIDVRLLTGPVVLRARQALQYRSEGQILCRLVTVYEKRGVLSSPENYGY